MIDTQGMISVAEAAKRLRLSIEQVRRKLREGKLKGHRVGNQWFVYESEVTRATGPQPLVSREVMTEVRNLARRIAERNPGYEFDPVELVHRAREED